MVLPCRWWGQTDNKSIRFDIAQLCERQTDRQNYDSTQRACLQYRTAKSKTHTFYVIYKALL